MAEDKNLPSPGDVVGGKYQIERLIGRGGMGAVFAARHMLLNQRVALKLLLGELADSQEASARFMNEARAAAQIQGEHVARVLDVGQFPSGAPFMVLEYLEGFDLSKVLHQRGPLPVVEVVDYALQALDALGQAHAAGIVHRDLKPANLFVTRRHDGTTLVKVLDFGISKNLTNPGLQGMTSTRAVLGSPEYMSPEQLRTPRGVDARTDIWSLGVILYELLTGKMPFAGDTLPELFLQILEKTPPPLRSLRADVPPGLELVVARCMTRDLNARYPHVKDLASELLLFASEQTRAMAFARGSGRPLAASSQPAATMPMVSTANTAAPWSGTMGGEAPEVRRSRKVALTAVIVLGLGVGGIGSAVFVRSFTGRDVAVTAEVPSARSLGAPPKSSVTAPAPPAVAAMTSVTKDAGASSTQAPSPVPPAAAPPLVKKDAPPPAALPSPAPPSSAPPPSATTATPAAKNCNPKFYFDKDGNKHFKPECY